MTRSQHVDIGARRELMIDEELIDRSQGGGLQLHHPIPREVGLITDKPWEGNACTYITVFEDEGIYRMYYTAWQVDYEQGRSLPGHPLYIAYAESQDGIQWDRPELNLIEYQGSSRNNLVYGCYGKGPYRKGVHGFAPFKDTNPSCPPAQVYKAVGRNTGQRPEGPALFAMVSPDGIDWSLLQEEPIITTGNFDSQNTAFWDALRGEYRAYVRDVRNRRRDIRTATSQDFINWSEPQWVEYPQAPDEQLYTNQIQPYHRAPHIFVGFPTRYVQREWSATIEALPELEHRRLRASAEERMGTALTESLFMSTRDGKTFKRWGEAFLRPGLRYAGNWFYGDNYLSWGMLETESNIDGAPRELSMYAQENRSRDPMVFRRYTLRIDGFVSFNAPLRGAEFVTVPVVFEGSGLWVNISTSAAGGARVEVQDPSGRPIEGYALEDCVEIVGDAIEFPVRWGGGTRIGRLSGRAVRLRFVLSDADLYSFRFGSSS